MTTKKQIWEHNSFFGHVGMTKANMRAIQYSKTTTKTAKEIAEQIERLAYELGEALKERVDA